LRRINPKTKKKEGRENFPYFASTSYQLFLEKISASVKTLKRYKI